jgi:hypothetical protein
MPHSIECGGNVSYKKSNTTPPPIQPDVDRGLNQNEKGNIMDTKILAPTIHSSDHKHERMRRMHLKEGRGGGGGTNHHRDNQ